MQLLEDQNAGAHTHSDGRSIHRCHLSNVGFLEHPIWEEHPSLPSLVTFGS